MRRLVTGIVVCVVVLGVVGSSLAKGDAEGKKKKDPDAAFNKRDANGDGRISVEEFVGKKEGDRAEKMKAAFQKKDKDNDGFVTKDEMTAKGKKKKKGDE
jgi:Ca2+-binding EF-hand superfamily protein